MRCCPSNISYTVGLTLDLVPSMCPCKNEIRRPIDSVFSRRAKTIGISCVCPLEVVKSALPRVESVLPPAKATKTKMMMMMMMMMTMMLFSWHSVDETKPATQVFPETRAIVSSEGDVLWVVPESRPVTLSTGVWVIPDGAHP